MTQNQKFIIARGIPGSGKSTWAEKWVAEDPFNRVRVNRDDIRRQLIQTNPQKYPNNDGWYVYDNENRLDKNFENQVSNLERSLITRALKAGKSVTSDNTNLTNSATKQWVQLANQYKIPLETKNFPITKEEAIQRDKNRDRSVGEKVINLMYNRLGPQGQFHHIDGTFPLQKFTPPQTKHPKAIGFDLDGTLCDVRAIRHYVQKDEKGRRNFDAFHRSSLFMPVHPAVVQMLKDAQKEGYAILITTARSAEYAEVSQKWLKENGIQFDNYYCRKKGDFRSDYEVKKDLINNIKQHYDLVRQVDDNPQAIKAFEENGISVTKVPFGDAISDTEVVKINNLFRTGGCLRCGKPLSKGTIGPRCAKNF